ncbi:unnamed protein product, partial [Mesorhabditis spiculigera]
MMGTSNSLPDLEAARRGMDEQQLELQMRSRVGRTASTDIEKKAPSYRDKVLIEKKVKPGDTLNKIALQYSVAVSDLKRANNLVNDQDFVARSVIKIPVSRLRHEMGYGVDGTEEDAENEDDRAPLIAGSRESRDASVEEIFHKTDNNIAQVRETLPEDRIPGSYFVDARSPETGWSIWLLLAAVVIVFIIIPLVLTIYEEETNVENTAHISQAVGQNK